MEVYSVWGVNGLWSSVGSEESGEFIYDMIEA